MKFSDFQRMRRYLTVFCLTDGIFRTPEMFRHAIFDKFRNSSQIAPLTPHSTTYFDKRQFSSKSIESSIASSKALGQNPLAVVASLIIAY
jgi:hypothetical protein